MARFGGRRFARLDDPRFLDHEGAELVLIRPGELPVEPLERGELCRRTAAGARQPR